MRRRRRADRAAKRPSFDWSYDLGLAAGWESDVGDDLEHRGAQAVTGSAWALGGKGFSFGEEVGLQLGAGYVGRRTPSQLDLSQHGLFIEAAGIWVPGEAWLLRVAPWMAGRAYGDPGRNSVLVGLGGVLRRRIRPGLALRCTARVGIRRAGDPAYDTQSFGLGAGLEIDLSHGVWVRAGYGFEGARSPSAGADYGPGVPPIDRPGPVSIGENLGGADVLAHVLAASLNLKGPGHSYLFADYAFTWLVVQGGAWATHTVALGLGLRR